VLDRGRKKVRGGDHLVPANKYNPELGGRHGSTADYIGLRKDETGIWCFLLSKPQAWPRLGGARRRPLLKSGERIYQ